VQRAGCVCFVYHDASVPMHAAGCPGSVTAEIAEVKAQVSVRMMFCNCVDKACVQLPEMPLPARILQLSPEGIGHAHTVQHLSADS
jgi:hypothetical protein